MSGFQCNAEGCEYVGDLQQLVIHANMAHPSKENNILKMLKITQYFDKKRSMKGEDVVGHLKLGTEELRDMNKGVWYGMVDRDQADKDILSGQHSSSINLDQTPTGPKKAKDVIKKKKSPLKRKRLLEKIKKIKKSEEKEKGEPSKKKKKILKKKRNYEDENKEKEVEPSTKKKKIIKKNGKPEPDPDRIKIHGRNRDPIKGNNKEMDCDFSWELDNCERDLEDLVDINPGEKKFMLMWNKFVYTHIRPNNRMATVFLKPVNSLFLEKCGLELIKANLYRNFLCHLMAYYSHNLMNNKDIMDLGIQFQEIMAEHPVERDMYIGKAWKEQKVAWIEHVNKKAKDPTIIEKKKRKEASILVDLPSQDSTSKDSTDTIFILDVRGEQIGQNGHSNEQDISEGETDNEVTIDDIVDEEVSFSPSPSKRKKFKRMEPSSDIMSSKTYPILERPDDQREAEILKMRTLIFEGYDPYTGIPLV